MKPLDFHLPTRIVFGPGRLAEAGETVSAYGGKAFVACDPYCVSAGIAQRLEKALAQSGIVSVIYDKVIPNPTCTLIDEGAKLAAAEGCEVVIGLGGGSSIDTAKGIAVAVSHNGPVWPYAIGEREITDSTLPIVAITTTSGTGSHCTCFAVITNPETSQKPGMGAPQLLPRAAIVDPELMLTVPKRLTAATGLDVFCHAVEALTSRASSPMSDLFAEKAIELVARHLPVCYADLGNLEARCGMALADTYAGIAICHAVVTLAHAITHVIGGHYPDIAHGDALHTIYPAALQLNMREQPAKHHHIARAIHPGNDNVVSAFENFFGQFEFEDRLRLKKPDEAKIDAMAEDTFDYMKAVAELNPVEADIEDARAILKASLS